MRFQDRVVVITGAAQGIGAAIARRLAAEGACVQIVDRDPVLGARTAAAISGATFIEADVANASEVAAAVDAIVQRCSHVDVLVNNAATANNTPFLELTVEEFDRVIAVNLRSQFVLGQMVARAMIASGTAGSIVNLSSMTARLGVATQAAYAASKGAVESLTRVMAVALADSNIRVNAVAPGTTVTPMVASFLAEKPHLRSQMLSRTPLGRLGDPEEIAAAVAFLASDDASYFTGQVLYPDGGRLALNYTVPAPETVEMT